MPMKTNRLLLPLILLSVSLYAGGTITPTEMFSNLEQSMAKIYPALIKILNLAGYFMILKAIFMLKKLGHRTAFMGGSSSLVGPIAVIFIGIIMINAQEFIKVIVLTLYGQKIQSTKDWESAHGNSDSWYSALTPIVGLVQVIGLVAFFRGIIILTKACNENSQPGNVSKGLMHILGGVMAVNITGTIDLIDKTLGF